MSNQYRLYQCILGCILNLCNTFLICINCKYSKHSNLQTSFCISECTLMSRINPVYPHSFHCPNLSVHITFFSVLHSCKHAVYPFVIIHIVHVYIWIADYFHSNTKAASVELGHCTEDIKQCLTTLWIYYKHSNVTPFKIILLLITELFISNHFKSVIVYLFPNQRNVCKSVHIIYEAKNLIVIKKWRIRCLFINSPCSCEHIFIIVIVKRRLS